MTSDGLAVVDGTCGLELSSHHASDTSRTSSFEQGRGHVAYLEMGGIDHGPIQLAPVAV
jgi:hypothetical protein